jgi:hypothetical protein
VNRERPCPVCGKADWCLIAEDKSAAICPRTESPKRCGDAGFLHTFTDTSHLWAPRRVALPVRVAPPDLSALASEYQRAATPEQLKSLAARLHLPVESLTAFRVGWAVDRGAWAFPMTDPTTGNVTNIRFRTPSGGKFSVRGGKESLFLPDTLPADSDELFVCEGATDAVAAHGIGFGNAVGRASCTGGTAHVVALVRARKPARVVLVRDNDEPGIRGADALARVLVLHSRDVRVLAPPNGVKDLRDWITSGATRDDMDQLIRTADVRQLKIIVRGSK